jgi:hypothetical protein
MEEKTYFQKSSIEVSKNSRAVTYSVKVYGDTVEEIDKTLNELVRKAEELKAKLEV